MADIQIRHVSFAYEKEHAILDDINININGSESIGLIGANGVGKSTLLKMMVGLNLDFQGEILVNGLPVKKDTLVEIRKKIGYVFQDSESQLFLSTAYEDIAFGPRNYGIPAAEVEERVNRALELTGISHLRNRQTYKMSGGEKKLVSIATILSMEPEIILMDEPSIALDPQNRRKLINILNSFNQLKIITSHDLDMIWDTCDRTILVADKKIVCDGDTKKILSDKELLESCGLELPLRLMGADIASKTV